MLSAAVLTGALAFLAPAEAARAGALHAPPANVSLKSTGRAKGILRTFHDVFTTNSFLDMCLVTAPGGKVKLLTANAGTTNQFQVSNADTGAVENFYTLPGEDKVSSTFGYDEATSTVYFGTGKGRLYTWSFTDRKLRDRGLVSPGAGGVYGFGFDDRGRVWGGSYPHGIIWTFDPKTAGFTRYPRLDTDTDYVRAIAVHRGIVYAGTASVRPKLVSFPVSDPGARTVIKLPSGGATGFVNRISARGDRVFVHAEDEKNVMRCHSYNVRSKAWEGELTGAGPRAFSGVPGSTSTFHVIGSKLAQTTTVGPRASTMLCTTNVQGARSVHQVGDTVYVAGRHNGEGAVARYSIAGRKEVGRVRPRVRPSALAVQSMIAADDGLLYIGGYLGTGLASLNPATDARWQSAQTTPATQIEHMIQAGNRIYLGSYGSAKLISYEPGRKAEGEAAFTLLATLRDGYMQSRPFAWAAAAGKVFAGTVPEYGLRGGALAVIDGKTNKVVRVMNKFIPEQSIVGLGASGDIIYGTTSGRPGYGIADYTGPATVFALDARTLRTLWTVSLSGHQELYSPMVINGELIVSTINGVIVLNPKNGKPVRQHMLRNRKARPGWISARSVRLPGTAIIAHSAGGVISRIDLKNRTVTELASGGFGTQMAFTPAGRLYASHRKRHIVELATKA